MASFSRSILLWCAVFFPATLSAQNKIKDGSVTGSASLPSSNAILELESVSKGFLLPRLALSSTSAASPLSAHIAGMSVYNTASSGDVTPGYYYDDGTRWVRLSDAGTADQSKDAWVDDRPNMQVRLGALSDGATARPDSTAFIVKDDGRAGIGTTTPQKQLHVNGALQITKELNVGGSDTAAGQAGTAGQVLVSGGAGTAPLWKSLNTVSGTVARTYYIHGDSALTVSSGDSADVPGVTLIHTVPAGMTQTLLFTITGYAVRSVTTGGQAAQGVFQLLQNDKKISSAFTSAGDGGDLDNLPHPVTMFKSVTLSAGTYTFKVRFAAWSDDQIVNFVPVSFIGYRSDVESMLTKMMVLVYNN